MRGKHTYLIFLSIHPNDALLLAQGMMASYSTSAHSAWPITITHRNHLRLCLLLSLLLLLLPLQLLLSLFLPLLLLLSLLLLLLPLQLLLLPLLPPLLSLLSLLLAARNRLLQEEQRLHLPYIGTFALTKRR